MEEIKLERLEKLGLKTASNKIKELKELKRKMSIAYEHYRYVKQEKINSFNQKLRQKTEKRNNENYYTTYDQLIFIKLQDYSECPPMDVLDKIEQAQEKSCFDEFEIAKIQNAREELPRPDPIVFGRINGCPDRFFIGQWDNDVSIEQILQSNEG